MTNTQFDPSVYVRQGLSLEVVQQMKKAFDLFDLQQSGLINTKQLQAAMTSLGFEARNKAVYLMISELDSDGKGNINFQEWLSLMTPRSTIANTKTFYNRVFQMYDIERTGFISASSIKRVTHEVGISLSDREIQQLIVRADLDEDGLVSQEEFYHLMTYRK